MADPFRAASTPTAASSGSETGMDGPACYTINSVPVIQTTGSDRFVTELAFKFAKATDTQKVSVSCSLQVEAKIWGLQSTLEPYMLSEAKKQLAQFVPFLAAYFREHGGAPMLSAVPDAGPSFCRPCLQPSLQSESAAHQRLRVCDLYTSKPAAVNLPSSGITSQKLAP